MGHRGDFNLIRFGVEKNNVNRVIRSMRDFGSLVNSLDLQESPLLNRRFIWTNGHDIPTLSRLDRFLLSLDCEEQFLHFFQDAHPRLIRSLTNIAKYKNDTLWTKTI